MNDKNDIKDLVVFGGLYDATGVWNYNNGLNDQCYNLAVPAVDKNGDVWMVDTWHIESGWCTYSTNGAIKTICGFGKNDDYIICCARYNSYYHNCMKIDSIDELNRFKLIADLHDYRALDTHEDYRDYKNDDLLYGVRLYREHGFKWGYGTYSVRLVRKGAKKDPTKELERAISDMYSRFRYPSCAWKSDIENLNKAEKKCIEDGVLTEELINKLHVVRSVNDKLDSMHNKICKYEKKLNKDYPY